MPSRDLTTNVDHLWELADDDLSPEVVSVRPPSSYRQAFGDKPIQLGIVEFRILTFLAGRPYHAYTRRQIVDALATNSLQVDDASIDKHVSQLRDQLGVLGDFVQTVPHVGFRYKA
jgi:two-component system phosphate regulon response regulator PhoB